MRNHYKSSSFEQIRCCYYNRLPAGQVNETDAGEKSRLLLEEVLLELDGYDCVRSTVTRYHTITRSLMIILIRYNTLYSHKNQAAMCQTTIC
jgi:hypothetical protein